MGPEENCVEKLLSYRELEFENSLALGKICLRSLEEYKNLANEAAKINPIAEYLPEFSMTLLDQMGAQGSIEYAFKNELAQR